MSNPKKCFGKLTRAVGLLTCTVGCSTNAWGNASSASIPGLMVVRGGDDQARVRSLTLHNRSDRPTSIMTIQTSCSDTIVIGFTKVIPPHGEGILILESLRNDAGLKESEVMIGTDQGAEGVTLNEIDLLSDDARSVDSKRSQEATSADAVLLDPKKAFEIGVGGGSRPVWIDLRSANEYNHCHIDGSVNWTISALRNLSSLKTRRLLLIGRGSSDDSIVGHALELESAGFGPVQVLRGGITAWNQLNLPVRWLAAKSPLRGMVNPVEFCSTRQDNWVLIRTGRPTAVPQDQIPGEVWLGAENDWATSLTQILQTALMSKSSQLKVLVMSDEGEHYDRISALLPSDFDIPVFFLEGGFRAYRQFGRDYAASKDRRELKLITAPGASLHSGHTNILNAAGCAACPDRSTTK